MKHLCQKRFMDGYTMRQCTKNAVVERNGKHYCKIHDPERVKAKAAERQAKFDKELEEMRVNSKLRTTAANACTSINPDNPQAVAESIGAMYEALKVIQCLAEEEYINRFVLMQVRQALALAENKGGE